MYKRQEIGRALDQHVAFVPGRAAYLDGRGANSMRLNFSGVGEADIREGVRRIGEVVREQIELYGTLTGTFPAVTPAHEPAPAQPDAALADVLHLPAPAPSPTLPTRRRRPGASEG